MARRKRVYSRRRRINYKRIVLLVAIIIVLILSVFKIFKKDSYISKIEEALNSEITQITATMSTVSIVDATIYENEGIKYTNQHEGIKRIVNIDETNEDKEKIITLFKNLTESEKTKIIVQLPEKHDGYYWIRATFVTKNKTLIFNTEKEYNFNLYYDIETKEVYVKEKYYDEFSKKYNKTKFAGYNTNYEFPF